MDSGIMEREIVGSRQWQLGRRGGGGQLEE